MRKHNLLVLGAVSLLGALTASCGGSTPVPTPAPLTSAPVPTTETKSVEEPTEAPPSPTEIADPVKRGASLAARYGCAACHSPDGSPKAGPTWLGLFGSEETLTDGSIVIVDEAYVLESIVDPNAKITLGFTAGIMPKDFSEKLSASDIEAIIAYMRTLE